MNASTPDPGHEPEVSPTEATIPAETLRKPAGNPPPLAPAWTPTPTAPEPGQAGRSHAPVDRVGSADPERTEVIPPSAVPRRPAPVPATPAPRWNPAPSAAPGPRHPLAPPPAAPNQPTYRPHGPAAHWTGYGPAGFGAPAPAGRKPSRRLVIGAVIAVLLVAVFLITGLWAPGFLRSHTLDIAAADHDVAAILSDSSTGYGLTAVTGVTCNDGKNPVIKSGATFTCDVTVDGAHRKLTATFTDDAGAFTISRPQ